MFNSLDKNPYIDLVKCAAEGYDWMPSLKDVREQLLFLVTTRTLSPEKAHSATKGSLVYASDYEMSLGKMLFEDAEPSELQDILIDADEKPFVVDGVSYKYILVVQPAPNNNLCSHHLLSYWLAKGNGEYKYVDDSNIPDDAIRNMSTTDYHHGEVDEEEPVSNIVVRRWFDNEWHEPTYNYMFGI